MALALLPNHLNRNTSNHSFDLLPPPISMDQGKSSRPSLPPISSLIDAVNERSENAKNRSSNRDQSKRISGGSLGKATSPERVSTLPGSPRNRQPPTPELPPASSFDFTRRSPNAVSPTAAANRNNLSGTSSTNPGLYSQRNSSYPPIPDPNTTYPPVPDVNHWTPIQPSRPSTDSIQPESVVRPTAPATYAEAQAEPPPYPSLTQQRPLPANFPPPMQGQTLPPIDPQMAPTWQHHHYYPPANPPSYPQTQERYVCPTCNKPFSRPSSLKIHTYSHTGEKPYKCKHEGCGKYFSVRSNMKRHEKGCHGGESASPGGNSPKTA